MTLAHAVQALYGDYVDVEAFSKMGPDPSGVHVPGHLTAFPVRRRRRKVAKRRVLTPEERRERLERNVARTSNAVGLAAGAAGTYTAATSPLLRAKIGTTHREPAKLVTRRGKQAAIAGLGLQAGNVLGDVVTARVLGRPNEVKKNVPLKQLKLGRMRSLRMTLGVQGKHTPGAGPRPGTLIQQPRPATPGAPRGAVPSNATGPLTPRQQSAMAGAAGMRQKAEDFVASTAGKATLGATAAVGTYGAGRRKGREDAYYGKRDGDVTFHGEFAKFDNEKRQAFGWASVVELNGEPVIDRQGDYIGIDDIEDAAYAYVRKSRVAGDMHRRTTGPNGEDAPFKAGEVIESVVFTKDKCHSMGLPASFAGKWWIGVQVEDDTVWEAVKKQARTGFSIHGKGIRKDVSLDELRSA